MAKGEKMSSREVFVLRTRLRQVNMEYSALIRDRSRERRFVRMAELRAERSALMQLLFGRPDNDRGPPVSRRDVAVQHAAE
jgi:hypothetical protein